ncbi:restriction endonuclease subunit S [Sunxiuqinia elliptica]
MSLKIEFKKLGNICNFVRGPFGGSLKKSCFKPDGYAVYEQQHAIYNQFTDIRYFVDEAKFKEMKRFELLEGDLIMSCSGTMGKVAIVPPNIKRGIINQALLKLTPSKHLDVEFLRYWMNSDDFMESIAKHSTGAAIKNVASVKVLKEIEMPCPSIDTQQQIVSILNKAFAAIDQAKANIERNIENAKELFQSKKEFLFNALSEACKVFPIESVCEQIFAGGDAPKENLSKEKTKEFSVPIIANAVKDHGLYGYTNEAKVTKPSITVAARGSGTGYTEFRNYPFVPIVRLIVLTPNITMINAEFLMHAIKNLIIERSGSAIPQLTVPMIKSYSIPVPDRAKQAEVTQSLNQIEIVLNDYKSKLEYKLNRLEELKKSILQKAFAGELTHKETVLEAIPLAAEPAMDYQTQQPYKG